MARGMLLVPLVIALVAGLGVALCAAAGWQVCLQEILVPGMIVLVAGEAALVPMNLARGSDAGQMAMIGLAGTVLHMLLGMTLIALALVAGLFKPTLPCAWWALAFYWTSLIAVVAVILGGVREAERRELKTNVDRPASR